MTPAGGQAARYSSRAASAARTRLVDQLARKNFGPHRCRAHQALDPDDIGLMHRQRHDWDSFDVGRELSRPIGRGVPSTCRGGFRDRSQPLPPSPTRLQAWLERWSEVGRGSLGSVGNVPPGARSVW